METDYDTLDKEQRLKATMYYSIKQIAKEVEEEMDVTISSQVLATLSECVSRQMEVYALDLERFAKHARRITVNVDDVKLLVRRNDTLMQHLNTFATEKTVLAAKKRKPKASSSKTVPPSVED